MAEALAGLESGLVRGREWTGLGKEREVSAAQILQGIRANPGGRLAERWSVGGEWLGWEYTAHGNLGWRW